jgi:hypothetical protein
MTVAQGSWNRVSTFAGMEARKGVSASEKEGAALMSPSDAWAEFDAKARAQEDRYEAAALAQFAAESNAVVRMLTANVPSFKAEGDEITRAFVWPYIEAGVLLIAATYSTSGAFFRQWYNRFRPLVAKTLGTADVPSVRIGILGRTSPQILAAINRRVTKLSGSVTETTLQQIRDVIAQARIDGVGVSELATRIRSQVFADTITTARATTIARTETVGALNEGAMLKAKQGGVFRSKQWVSQRDGRVRDTHRAAEAAGWIPIESLYSNGLDYPHAPGAPAAEVVNCRCSQMFSDLTADEANGGAT